jgi:hypothetical protein
MSIVEVLPTIRALSRVDKLRLIQLLAEDLAQDEQAVPFEANHTYPLWSPDRAYEAAAVLLQELEQERTRS